MTHKRKQRRLQRLERLLADDNLLEHWARGCWMQHTWIFDGNEEPDECDNSGCPYERRQSDVYGLGENSGWIIAPFCSLRGVQYETDCGTEYDAECDGCSKDCWLLFFKWHLANEINRLKQAIQGCAE